MVKTMWGQGSQILLVVADETWGEVGVCLTRLLCTFDGILGVYVSARRNPVRLFLPGGIAIGLSLPLTEVSSSLVAAVEAWLTLKNLQARSLNGMGL